MRTWFCYPTLSASMPFQMALDEVLFCNLIEGRRETGPVLRFYFSSEPWVTVGYSYREQALYRSNGVTECRGKSGPFFKNSDTPIPPYPDTILMCKRITGGGRVLHGKDLLFSIVGHKEDDESFKSVRISYWKIHEAVKTAYEALGIMPRFYRCDEELPRGSDCFVSPMATDLALGDQKIAGGAQKRSSGVFLHQESLKIPASLDADALIHALRSAFEKVFGIRVENMICEPEDLDRAKEWAREKYEESGRNREEQGGTRKNRKVVLSLFLHLI